jgi:hypothetical protein
LPNAPEEVPQRQILYTALFLLIWGEAGNLRFMPECLAYIFHNVSYMFGRSSICEEEFGQLPTLLRLHFIVL